MRSWSTGVPIHDRIVVHLSLACRDGPGPLGIYSQERLAMSNCATDKDGVDLPDRSVPSAGGRVGIGEGAGALLPAPGSHARGDVCG